ncbi:MAG: hypothetical protein AB7O96_16160 [Pseudobdellovibrionaceae bacterium]
MNFSAVFFVILSIVFFSSAFAVPSTESQEIVPKMFAAASRPFPISFEKNISRGHMQVGGGANLSYGSQSGTVLYVQPSFEYFIMDHISLGASIDYSASRTYTFSGIGPSATWYFAEFNQWATFAHQGFNFVRVKDENGTETSTTNSGVTGLGISHFFTPAISFGVGAYVQYFQQDVGTRVDALGKFQIFF